MLTACFVILLNLNNTKIAVDINHIAAVEASTNNNTTYVYSSRTYLSLTSKDNLETVLKKIQEAKATCIKDYGQ